MAISDRQDVVALFRELVRVAQGSRKDWEALAGARSPRPIESMTGAPIDEEGMQKATASRASEEGAATSTHDRRVEAAKQRSQDFMGRIARAEALPEAAMARLGLKELPAVEPAEGDAAADPNGAVNDFERHSKGVVARSLNPAGSGGLPIGRLALVAGAIALVAALVMMNQHQQPGPSYDYNPTPFRTATPPPTMVAEATPTDVSTEAPTDTPAAVDTPTAVTADSQASPNETPGAAGSALPALPPAFNIQTGLAYSGSAGKGGLQVVVMTPSGPRQDAYSEVHQTKTDVLGNPVPGDGIASARSDQTGVAAMEVPAGTYIVLTNLTGYNWGDIKTAEGQSGVKVTAGATTRLTIKMGSITFVPTTVDGIISDHYSEIHLQKVDSVGGIVTGDGVASGRTDNTGAVTYVLTPGDYIIRSGFTGYNWGNLSDAQGTANVRVTGGNDTRVNLQLGRLRVAATQDTYVEVHLQKPGSSGDVLGDGVASGRSDNTGYWICDLTSGSYTIKIGNQTYSRVVITSGKVTDFTP